jgi:hypothetical protein
MADETYAISELLLTTEGKRSPLEFAQLRRDFDALASPPESVVADCARVK